MARIIRCFIAIVASALAGVAVGTWISSASVGASFSSCDWFSLYCRTLPEAHAAAGHAGSYNPMQSCDGGGSVNCHVRGNHAGL